MIRKLLPAAALLLFAVTMTAEAVRDPRLAESLKSVKLKYTVIETGDVLFRIGNIEVFVTSSTESSNVRPKIEHRTIFGFPDFRDPVDERIKHNMLRRNSKIKFGSWSILKDSSPVFSIQIPPVLAWSQLEQYILYAAYQLEHFRDHVVNAAEERPAASGDAAGRQRKRAASASPESGQQASSSPADPDKPDKTGLSPNQRKEIRDNNLEFSLKGLVFFAELKRTAHAFLGEFQDGNLPVFGLCRTDSKETKYEDCQGVTGVRFDGDPAQGLRYSWKAIDGSKPRSISVWFCVTGYNRYGTGNALLSYGRKDFGQYCDFETNRKGGIHCAWGEPEIVPSATPLENKWHHLVVTYDGSRRISYLDGRQVGIHAVKYQTAATDLMIGTRIDDTRHCFVGYIRNVAVFNRKLFPSEVARLSRKGLH